MNQLTDGINKKLVRLLDYVEEVVRLDERVAMRLSEYRLPDKTAFAVFETDTRNLPGVRHDVRDDEGNIWVSIDRLTRHGPPAAPEEIKDWIAVSDDPQHGPEIIYERLVTVTRFERDKAVSAGSQSTCYTPVAAN